MDKKILDAILHNLKVQPAGNGYIDLIVSREFYKPFVTNLIENEFLIKSISWWEWCSEKEACKYGLGGPESKFYNGWFADLPIDIDDINLSNLSNEESIGKVINLIESKSIKYPNEVITFSESSWLIPGIWLDVPNNWKNEFV